MEDQNKNSEDSQALATTKPDIEAIQVKNSRGKGHRTLYRDNRANKFISAAEARAILSAKDVADHLESKDEAGTTVRQRLIAKVTEMVLNAKDEKSLIGISKALTTLDKLSGSEEARANLLKDKGPVNNGIKTVVIRQLVDRPTVKEAEKPVKTTPSFATAPFIDGEIVQQNSAPNTTQSKSRKERRVAQIPAPYCPAWRRATDSGKA